MILTFGGKLVKCIRLQIFVDSNLISQRSVEELLRLDL